MNKYLTLCLLILAGTFVSAQESELTFDLNIAYYFPSLRGHDANGYFSAPGYQSYENPSMAIGEVESLGGSFGAPGLEGALNYSYTLPFLTGEGALFKDNNLQFSTWGSLTPVSLYGAGQVTITPMALLKFRAGMGSGWGWTVLGLKGLGRNIDGETAPDSFGGTLLQAWAGATFQFDLGAVVPGDWNHILTVADFKWQYQNFTGAKNDQPWYWQADSGENFNGLKQLSTYFLGYQLPEGMGIHMFGVLTNVNFYLGEAAELSPMGDTGGWGSDFVYWAAGPMVNLKFSDSSSLVMLLQFQDKRKATDDTAFRKLFTERDYHGGVMEFYIAALAWSWKL